MPVRLWALDEVGGLAIARVGESWYRLAIEEGWTPVPLSGECDAARFTLSSGTIRQVDDEFPDIDALVQEARRRCLVKLPTPTTRLRDVLHLFPSEFRRAAAAAISTTYGEFTGRLRRLGFRESARDLQAPNKIWIDPQTGLSLMLPDLGPHPLPQRVIDRALDRWALNPSDLDLALKQA